MSSKRGNMIKKSEDVVKQWTPEKIVEEFVCNFVNNNNNNDIILISIMLYLNYVQELKTFGIVKNKI